MRYAPRVYSASARFEEQPRVVSKLQLYRSLQYVDEVLSGVLKPFPRRLTRIEHVLVGFDAGRARPGSVYEDRVGGPFVGLHDLRGSLVRDASLLRWWSQQTTWLDPESFGQRKDRGETRCGETPLDLAEERLGQSGLRRQLDHRK